MAAGHTFLASLGKTRLRPGGITGTNWLLDQVVINEHTKILEVACNMGTTAIELAQRYHCQITGIDTSATALQQATQNIKAHNMTDFIQVQQANARHLPFADNTFDIVVNEAMLTMLTPKAKEEAIAEYLRVLKPGGTLLTHDVAFRSGDAEKRIAQLRTTIQVQVSPLTTDNWQQLFKDAGFQTVKMNSGSMTLMSPYGMVKDEGFLRTLKIIKNGLKKENCVQFKKMFRFFNGAGKDLQYIVLASTKGEV